MKSHNLNIKICVNTTILQFLFLLIFSLSSIGQNDCVFDFPEIYTEDTANELIKEIDLKLEVEEEFECGIQYGDSLSRIIDTYGLHTQVKTLYNSLGYACYDRGDYARSVFFFKRSVDYRQKHKLDQLGIASAYNNVAKSAAAQNQFDEAIANHEKAIEIAAEIINKDTNRKDEAHKYHNIYSLAFGNTYLRKAERKRVYILRDSIPVLKEEEKALNLFKDGYEDAIQIKDSARIARALVKMADVYRERPDSENQWAQAFEYANQASQVWTDLLVKEPTRKSYRRGLATSYTQLGRLNTKLANYSESFRYHRDAKKIYEEIESYTSLAVSVINIAHTHEKNSAYDSALYYYHQAQRINKTHGNPDYRTEEVLQGLYEVHQKLGNYDSAFYFLQKFDKFQAQKLNQELDDNTVYAKETLALNVKDVNNKAEIARQSSITLFTVIISIVVVVLLGLLIAYYVQRNRTEKAERERDKLEFKEREKIMEEKVNSIIVNSEQNLIKTRNETQEKVLKSTGQDLHDDICTTLTVALLEMESLYDSGAINSAESKDKYLKIKKDIATTNAKLRDLSHNLTNPSLSGNHGLIPALKELIQKINGLPQSPKIEFDTFNLKSKNLSSKAETYIFRMIQESVNNILKYANAKQASIQLVSDNLLIDVPSKDKEQDPDVSAQVEKLVEKGGYENDESEIRLPSLGLTISDDGIGFDLEENAGGLGIKSIKSRTQELGGTLLIETSPGKGTTLFIELPLAKVLN